MRATTTAIALFVLLPLSAAAQTTQWVVRDVDGKLVGPVLPQAEALALTQSAAEDPMLLVARRVPGRWLTLPVTRDAVRTTRQHVPFLFETPDCSGPAFLDAPQENNQASATVIFDTQVYWAAGHAESRAIRAKGVLVRDAAECSDVLLESNLCCTPAEEEGVHFAGEISTAPLTHLSLRPPFRVEAVAAEPRN